MRLVCAFVIATIVFAASAQVFANDAIVAGRNAALVSALQSQDSTAIARLYGRDAVVMPPDGAEPVVGQDAITAYWRGFLRSGAARLDLTTSDTIALGETAILERGSYMLRDQSGVFLGEGQYVAVWTLENGQWLVTWNIWNERRRGFAIPNLGEPQTLKASVLLLLLISTLAAAGLVLIRRRKSG